MAASSLFMLLDVIGLMTKVAAPKSSEVTSRRA